MEQSSHGGILSEPQSRRDLSKYHAKSNKASENKENFNHGSKFFSLKFFSSFERDRIHKCV